VSSSPAPADRIEAWLGILGALAGAGAWIAARLRAWRRSRALAASVREARDRYYHAGADAARLLLLHLFGDRDERLTPDEILRRAAIVGHELQSARRDLWLAEGRPDPESDPDAAELAREVIREMRRTQPVRPVDDGPQDVFREDDRG
jgi:hypothetical protein